MFFRQSRRWTSSSSTAISPNPPGRISQGKIEDRRATEWDSSCCLFAKLAEAKEYYIARVVAVPVFLTSTGSRDYLLYAMGGIDSELKGRDRRLARKSKSSSFILN